MPLYGEVEVREVYPGIHQRWYFDRGWLRYDYIVSPGADVSRLRFAVEGADGVWAEGDKLMLGTRFGAVERAGLYVYQGRERISAQWVVEGSEVSIAVGSYDRTQPLIIDPLVWSTFLGGSGGGIARSLAVDGSGAVYVTGVTGSSDFPTTAGSYDTTHNGGGMFLSPSFVSSPLYHCCLAQVQITRRYV